MRRNAIVVVAVVVGVATLLATAGCGGGLAPGTGFVEGYLYVRPDTCELFLSTSPTPPDGFVPAANATLAFPDGTTVVAEPNGHFFASNLPLGTQTITLRVPGCPDVTITVTVTEGGIHSGGFGGIS